MSSFWLYILVLLSPHTLWSASLARSRKRVITPQLHVFTEDPELPQARDKIEAVHLSFDTRIATRGMYFFEVRYDGVDYLNPQLFVSEFINGRQHVFIAIHLGLARGFRAVSIYKNDLTGEYYIIIFAHYIQIETNL